MNITKEETEAGTLKYEAPEVISSRAVAHPGIDIWAMGCILFYMVNGSPPFDGDTKEEIV